MLPFFLIVRSSYRFNAAVDIVYAVALNYQTYDMPKKMNFGKFNQNGNCGYVLKPQFLLTDDGTGGGNAESTSPRKLVITIISGQNFPIKKTDQRDILDPYVTVRVVGDPQDSFSYKTQVVSNNGSVINKKKLRTFSFSFLLLKYMRSVFSASYRLESAVE